MDIDFSKLGPEKRIKKEGDYFEKNVMFRINTLPTNFLRQNIGIRHLSLRPRLPKLPSFKITQDAPGNIIGTVNDAYVVPPMEMEKGSFHWAYERIAIVAMAPLTILPFVIGVEYPIIDSIFGSLLLIHSRYGLQSCIIDYIPLRKFGTWHKLAMLFLNLGTLVGLYGVYVIETENNGLYTLIKNLWTA